MNSCEYNKVTVGRALYTLRAPIRHEKGGACDRMGSTITCNGAVGRPATAFVLGLTASRGSGSRRFAGGAASSRLEWIRDNLVGICSAPVFRTKLGRTHWSATGRGSGTRPSPSLPALLPLSFDSTAPATGSACVARSSSYVPECAHRAAARKHRKSPALIEPTFIDGIIARAGRIHNPYTGRPRSPRL